MLFLGCLRTMQTQGQNLGFGFLVAMIMDVSMASVCRKFQQGRAQRGWVSERRTGRTPRRNDCRQTNCATI